MNRQKRARKGGEIGMNGEFYQGGEFLPNTDMASQHTAKAERGTGKQQVAPHTWEVAPEGKKSIYTYIAGVFGRVVNGQMIIDCSDTTVAYYKTNRFALAVLAAKYNKGEYWF
jgi:hypothetical protein